MQAPLRLILLRTGQRHPPRGRAQVLHPAQDGSMVGQDVRQRPPRATSRHFFVVGCPYHHSDSRGRMPDAPAPPKPFRILSLDGGGAKGFYTLGVLHEIEALLGKPLSGSFQVIYGTSTGSIIASLLALGHSVDEIY